MKKLILAAALFCVPAAAAAAVIVAGDNDEITNQELVERAQVCVGLISGDFDSNKVIAVYKLDTVRKQRDFAIGCKLMQIGYEAASQRSAT